MIRLTGSPRLIRLALRRDRVQLGVWLLGVPGLMAAIATTMEGLYANEAERTAVVAFSANSPVARAFDGPASGTSLGAMVIAEGFMMLAVLVALMSTFLVVRHTRQNEETGRAELIGAAVVGHHALLAAALAVAAAANLGVGAGVTAVLLLYDLPLLGSVLTGVALAAVGLAFAGVAAVTSQVLESARAANGVAGAVVGIAFLLRAVGDALGSVGPTGLEVISAWPSWLSPIGWAQQVRPFHQDQLPPLLLLVGLTAALTTLAVVLISHRDLGTGMLPTRRGPARADRRLLSPLGLAWRLQRGVLAGWMVGVAALGAAFASLGDEVADVIETSEQLAEAFAAMAGGAEVSELFLAIMLGIVGSVAGGFVVQALLRLRSEEVGGAAEGLLATAVSRPRWVASHVVIAVAGLLAILLVTGLTAGLTYGLVVGDVLEGLATLLPATLVQLPPSLALAGFVLLVFGALPRHAATVGWGVYVGLLLLGQIGAFLELPQAVLDVSPYTHVPQLPAADLTVFPLLALTGVGLGLGGAGFAAFRRRDLAL
jgi:ABC-2 type transport system permease protein